MSKILFSSKCQVLGELWLYHRKDAENNTEWAEFFEWADIALPMSYCIWQGIVVLNDDDKDNDGTKYVNEAYDIFCGMIGVPNDVTYKSLGHAFKDSPNAPIDNG